jgi:hypothetical protein
VSGLRCGQIVQCLELPLLMVLLLLFIELETPPSDVSALRSFYVRSIFQTSNAILIRGHFSDRFVQDRRDQKKSGIVSKF